MPEPASVPVRAREPAAAPEQALVRARELAVAPEPALVREPGPAQGPAAKESDLGADSG